MTAALGGTCLLLIVSHLNLDVLIVKRLLEQRWRYLLLTRILPTCNVHVVFVVTLCLSILSLGLLTEMSTAALITLQRIIGNKLTHGDEVAKVDGLVELDIESLLVARDTHVLVEFLTDVLQHGKSLLQTSLVAGHANVIPHNMIELFVNRVNTLVALDIVDAVDFGLNTLLGLLELRCVRIDVRHLYLVGEVVLHCIRNDEVTVGQTLHKHQDG